MYQKLQFLQINESDKLGLAKLMTKVDSNKLPVIGDKELQFTKVFLTHSYPARAAASKNYYLQRIKFAKIQQSVKTSEDKIWNNLPDSTKKELLLKRT